MLKRNRLLYTIVICTCMLGLVGCENSEKFSSEQKENNTLIINNNNSEELAEKTKEHKIKEVIKEESNDIAKLVNKEFSLDEGYKPEDLVVPNVRLYCSEREERSHLRYVAAKALEEMFRAAESEGIELYLVSAFRSSNYQEGLYNNSLMRRGEEYTNRYIAKPNHSEHQTGLVADISTKSMNYELEPHFRDTEEGKWLANNAHKYGFILRYKEGREAETGYSFEPWHFRYVGKELSEYVFENNLILEDLYKIT